MKNKAFKLLTLYMPRQPTGEDPILLIIGTEDFTESRQITGRVNNDS